MRCSRCGYVKGHNVILIPRGRCPSCGAPMGLEIVEASPGLPVEIRDRLESSDELHDILDRAELAGALNQALREAPEAKASVDDAAIVLSVLRQWYGAEAVDVLRAALELAQVQA